MELLKTILSNGFIMFIPILVWNFALVKYLPKEYNPKTFDILIPPMLLAVEGFFRFLIFVIPFFIKTNYSTGIGKIGFTIYLIGVLIYFSSWIVIITLPHDIWSNNFLIFAAPAHTIIIWLIGFSLIADSYYFHIKFSRWHYIVPALLMTFTHTYHAYLVYLRELK